MTNAITFKAINRASHSFAQEFAVIANGRRLGVIAAYPDRDDWFANGHAFASRDDAAAYLAH